EEPIAETRVEEQPIIEEVDPLELFATEALAPVKVKEEVKSVEKPGKKKHSESSNAESESAEFKKAKKKPKYQTFTREEDEQDVHRRGGRNKFKKKKGTEKSDKYREAEESLTHGFALPTA